MTSAANGKRRSGVNDNNPFRFYVYGWWYPEGYAKSGPFYIGKGHGNRGAALKGRNTHFNRVVAKMKREGFSPIVKRLQDALLEADAFRLERGYIALFGRVDLKTGVLCNQTDGGEGNSGRILSEESRAKIREALTGKILSEEHRAKIGVSGIGKKRTAETRANMSATQCNRSPEWRAKLSAARSNPNPEWRAKISAANRGKRRTPEQRARISEAHRVRFRDPDQRAKLSAARIGTTLNDEHRAKISAAEHMHGPRNGEFKGVSFHKATGKWRATIQINGKQRSLGIFPAPEEAAKAWDAAAFETRPNGTYLNFPEDYGLPSNDSQSGRQAA